MDDEEFRRLAMAEIDAVSRLARHLAGRPEEAEDLVQDTYLRAFRFAAGFKLTEVGIRPWLFKILHNVANGRLSAEQRRREALEEIQIQAPPVDHQGGAAPALAHGAVDWEGVDQRLKAAIHDLPLALRTPFLLSAVEELKYRHIAEVIDVPVGTVMSRLYRARTLLSQRLASLVAEQRLAGTNNGSDGRKGGIAPTL